MKGALVGIEETVVLAEPGSEVTMVEGAEAKIEVDNVKLESVADGEKEVTTSTELDIPEGGFGDGPLATSTLLAFPMSLCPTTSPSNTRRKSASMWVIMLTSSSVTGSSIHSLVANIVYKIYHTTAAVPAPLWQPP